MEQGGVFFSLICSYTLSDLFATCRNSLVVQLLLSRDVLATLPEEKVRQGKKIGVVPILFVQGVNEKQTLANLKHE
jgi:chorismate mutase